MADVMPCPRCNEHPHGRDGLTSHIREYRCRNVSCFEHRLGWLWLKEWNKQEGVAAAVKAAVDDVAETAMAEMGKVTRECEVTVKNVLARHEKAVADAATAARERCVRNMEEYFRGQGVTRHSMDELAAAIRNDTGTTAGEPTE